MRYRVSGSVRIRVFSLPWIKRDSICFADAGADRNATAINYGVTITDAYDNTIFC